MKARQSRVDLRPAPDYRVESLETRLLFSADVAMLAANDGVASAEQIAIVENAQPASASDDTDASGYVAAEDEPRELIVVDADAPNLEALLTDFATHKQAAKVVVLESHGDGLNALGEILEQERGLTALHIVSHGEDGVLALGGSHITTLDLLARSADIANWRHAFSVEADLLIYGCNVAGSADGRNFVDTLARLTQTDVAASDNLTGGSASGGDWQLEYSKGSINSDIVASNELQAHYDGTFAVFTVTDFGDSGTNTLRWAIDQVNAGTGGDVIQFSGGGTVSLTSQLPEIVQQTIIDATVGTGYSGVPTVVLDGNAMALATEDGLRFSASSGGSIVRGLTIIDMPFYGIRLTNVSGITIESSYIGTDGTNNRGNGDAGIALFSSANNVIGGAGKGNVISGNGGEGIRIENGISSNNTIQGNYIGTNAAGDTAIGNVYNGILISAGASSNTIGGDAGAGEGNLISGNGFGSGLAFSGVTIDGSATLGNMIYGNTIGLNASGNAALPNDNMGIYIEDAFSTFIGNSTAGYGNTISGNGNHGIYAKQSDGNQITGNSIGTNDIGSVALGNNVTGIYLDSSSNNTIGGSSVADRNIIVDNGDHGVQISGGSSNDVQGNYIGIAADSVTAMGNGDVGIAISGGANNSLIGGNRNTGEGNVISGNSGSGIFLEDVGTSNNTIAGNRIGTNAAGSAAVGNGAAGIEIAGAFSNTIGGSSDADRNLISGNGFRGLHLVDADFTVVEGNYIGTDESGENSIQNFSDGIKVEGGSSNVRIGGVGAGNLISGNQHNGIEIEGSTTSGNTVIANTIGTNATGDTALANGFNGVLIDNSTTGNIIGGDSFVGEGNLISGNSQNGVMIEGSSTSGTLLAGNRIGTSLGGTVAIANGEAGVHILNGAKNNLIGGATAGHGNLISGNTGPGVYIATSGTANNTIQSNYIGTDETGTGMLGNSDGVSILDAPGNTIGGDSSFGEGNLISGNDNIGVSIEGSGAIGNTVAGNLIGVDLTGLSSLANGYVGLGIIFDASNTLVGGSSAVEGNVLSGNTDYGVSLFQAGSGNVLSGNTIGLGTDGDTAVGNGEHGVAIRYTEFTLVGTDGGANIGNVIAGNGGSGIWISGLGSSGTNDNTVAGNKIGTDVSGTLDRGNAVNGVLIEDRANNNTIGGASVVERNLISGNSDDGVEVGGSRTDNNQILGNWIGTDINGTSAVPNGSDGVQIHIGAQQTIIGGSASGAGNLISGNTGRGVYLASSSTTDTRVIGNLIGTTESGNAPLGNGREGIHIDRASFTFIGGLGAGESNTISANGRDGILVEGSSASDNEILGNRIGTSSDGTLDLGNASVGIRLLDGARDTVVFGNQISGNDSGGIVVDGNGGSTTVGNMIYNNTIGTDVNGTGALENSGDGIAVLDGARNTQVGGDGALGYGNLVSGHAANAGVSISGSLTTGTQVAGNQIGTAADGSTALGNLNGIVVADTVGTRIGGASSGEMNLVSGNVQDGIVVLGVASSGVQIMGNRVGTTTNGLAANGNGRYGVWVTNSAANVQIGGETAGNANTVSGNGAEGIFVSASGVGNVIAGNRVGLGVDGNTAMGNGAAGIYIDSEGVLVGGVNAAAGNTISSNGSAGIWLTSNADNTRILSNIIGLDEGGTLDRGNAGAGVSVNVADSVSVGEAGSGNTISANNGVAGVHLSGSIGSSIVANKIGTSVDGLVAFGNNGPGVLLDGDSLNNQVGGSTAQANVIKANSGAGVHISNVPGILTNTSVLSNVISSNGGLGIDLGAAGVLVNDPQDADAGANDLQNYPVLTFASTDGVGSVTLSGTVDSTPDTDFRVDYYGSASADPSGHGEAEQHLGTTIVRTDNTGVAAFTDTLSATLANGEFVTATLTSLNGVGTALNTSEFSANVVAVDNSAPIIVNLELITNGDFATADLSGWSSTGTVFGSTGSARFGQSNIPSPHSLSQTFSTVAGESYTLEFQYRDDNTVKTQTLQTTVSGNSVLLNEIETSAVVDTSFTSIVYRFVADSATSTLTFTDISDDSTGVDGYIDNISIMASAQLDLISENDAGGAGQTIASLLSSVSGDVIQDADAGAVEGIAITSITPSEHNSTIQYSIDSGSSWTSVWSVAESDALVLRATDLIRFQPVGGTSEIAEFSFRAWDQTAGVAGDRVNTASHGGSSPFSVGSMRAYAPSSSVNDAPQFGSHAPGLSLYTPGSGIDDMSAQSDVITLSDGGVLVVGTSSSAGTLSHTLTKFTSDGSVDKTFGDGGRVTSSLVGSDDRGFAVAEQADGRLLVAGSVDNGSDYDAMVTRYLADGTLDTGFGTVGIFQYASVNDDAFTSLETLGTGDIVLGGYTGDDSLIAQLDASGSPVAGFGASGVVVLDVQPGQSDSVEAIAIQADGRIVLAGLQNDGSVTSAYVARLLVTGALDASFGAIGIANTQFNSSGVNSVNDMLIQSDGSIVIAGIESDQAHWGLTRFDTAGTVDGSFGSGGHLVESFGGVSGGMAGIVQQADGKLVVAGDMDLGKGQNDWVVTRYELDGSRDSLFADQGIATPQLSSDWNTASAIDIAGDGSLIVAGSIAEVPQGTIVMRFNTSGTPDANSFSGRLNGAPDFTEDDAAVVLDEDVTVFDQELSGGNFNGSSLTLQRAGIADNQDTFEGSGLLSTLVEGGSLVYDGMTVGSVITNSGGVLTLSFNGLADNQAINELMQSITYSHSGDTPPASVQIDWQFDDGNAGDQGSGGALQAVGNTVVSITPTNDNPVITTGGGADAVALLHNENQAAVISVSSTDADGGAPVYAISGGADASLFSINQTTGELTFDIAPDFEAPNDSNSDNVYDVTVEVSDGNGGSDSVQILVNVVNLYEANDDSYTTNTQMILSEAAPGLLGNDSVADLSTVLGFDASTDADSNGSWTSNTGSHALQLATGVVHTASPTNPSPGINAAYVFNGAGGATSGSLDSLPEIDGTQNASIEFWFRSDSLTGDVVLFNTGDSNEGSLLLNLEDSSLRLTASEGGSNSTSQFSAGLTAGTWHHVVVGIDMGPTDNISVWVDGILADKIAITGAWFTHWAEGDFGLGTMNGTSSLGDFSGQISHFRIHDGDLNSADINKLMNDPNYSGTTVANSDDSATIGIVVVNADGSFTYDPNGQFDYLTSGQSATDSFTYTIDDGTGTDSLATVTITLNGVNDDPVIVASSTVTADENQTAVLTLGSSDADGGTPTYSIAGGSDAALFSIDTVSGDLTFQTAPDFESPSDADANNIYDLDVRVSDGNGGTDTQSIAVSVANVNEAPVITSAATESVVENQTAVQTVTSADVDGGTPVYSISGGSDSARFSIDGSSGALSFLAAPDFESPVDANADNIYQVIVEVRDGNGGLATQSISVTVTDTNEPPVVTAPASVSVAENQSAVMVVTGSDDDGDTLAYTLIAGSDADRFVIDSGSGELTFRVAPDFDAPSDANTDNVYNVTVQVADGKGGVGTQSIAVRVTNVNEDPVITSPVNVSVAENVAMFMTVTSSDDDGDTPIYSISGGVDAAAFTINSANGLLGFNTAPDFESPADSNTDNVYLVEVAVDDGNGSSDRRMITVTVINGNEFPQINSTGTVSIAENLTQVLTVTSTDEDADAPQYSIAGGADGSRFSINGDSGALAFVVAPDYETPSDAGADNVYNVTVQVADGNGGVDTQAIAVTVNNVNESPVISSQDSASVPENTTAVLSIAVSDEDGDALVYSIDGGADAALFSIDSSSGTLSFVNPPDVEAPSDADADNRYEVVIQASDGNGGVDTQALTVTVSNVNEAPVITSAAQVSVRENVLAAVTLSSTDPEGDTPTYAISGGSDASRFAIDRISGALTFLTPPDFEQPSDVGNDNTYQVIVRAIDKTGAIQEQGLTIAITDENESPVAVSDTVQATEDELRVIDIAMELLVNDTDPESDPLQVISFSQPEQGVITLNNQGALEYQPNADFFGTDRFTYRIEDSAGRFSSATVRINVESVNDAPALSEQTVTTGDSIPNIITAATLSGSTVQMAENAQWVGSVGASDIDGDTITFSVTGVDAALFEIDQATGVLRPLVPLDFESPIDSDGNNLYELEITASDTQGGQVTVPVTVSAVDVNEAPQLVNEVFVMEEGFSGNLGRLVAFDPDAGEDLIFELVSVNGSDDVNASLVLNADGWISTTELAPGSYELQVSVSDSQGLVSLGQIVVVVTPLSDGEPPLGGAFEVLLLPESEITFVTNGLVAVEVAYTQVEEVKESQQVSDVVLVVDLDVLASESILLQDIMANNDVVAGDTDKEESSQAVTLDRSVHVNEEKKVSPLKSIVSSNLPPTPQQLLDLLDRVRSSFDDYDSQEEAAERRTTLVVSFGGVVFSIGFASWLLSSRILLAAALSTASLWRTIDPIPVLLAGTKEQDDLNVGKKENVKPPDRHINDAGASNAGGSGV